MEQKFRAFCFTDFEKNHDFWREFYENNNVVWLKYGEEVCPKSKREHLQGVVYFKSPRTLTSVIKKTKPRHIEVCRGSIEDNDKYVSKEGKTIEFGSKPQQGQRNDLEVIQKKIDEGVKEVDIAREHFGKWCQYGKRFEAYRALVEPKRDWEPQVIILQGKPGTGKTTRAVKAGAVTLTLSGSYENPFVSGYGGEDVVLFDDFDWKCVSKLWFLKITGGHPLNINIKGGERNWKPRIIYITTNEDAQKWWNGDKAWLRRITSVENF